MESHHVFLLFFYLIFIQKKYTYLHVAFWTFTNLNLTVSRDKSDFDMRQLRANLLCQSLWNTKHDHVQNLQIGLELFFANSSICASYYSSHAHCNKIWYFIQPKSWQNLIYGDLFGPQNEKSAILDTCANVHFLADFIFGEKWFHEFFWHFLHIWEESTFCMNYSASLKLYYFFVREPNFKNWFCSRVRRRYYSRKRLDWFCFFPFFCCYFFSSHHANWQLHF